MRDYLIISHLLCKTKASQYGGFGAFKKLSH